MTWDLTMTDTREDRAARMEAGITKVTWFLMKEQPECVYCRLPWAEHRRPTRDHIRPRSAGGTYAQENTVLACGECNRARGRAPYWLYLLCCEYSHRVKDHTGYLRPKHRDTPDGPIITVGKKTIAKYDLTVTVNAVPVSSHQ